ncbi:MAG TPA: hypothetical protein VHC68_03680 [Candidatus Paceibacterota bacterium]|nr:hypothetical protein [Candidatus Paceibacterota bacterium]
MKPLAHHLAAVRAKPPHVRKQIAFALAGGATALIALLWLAASLASGAFRIADTSYADAGAEPAPAPAPAGSSLLGAAAAALAGSSTAAQLEVVSQGNEPDNAPAPAAPQENVIPF